MIDKKLIKLYAIAIISIALIITIVLYSFDFKAFLDKGFHVEDLNSTPSPLIFK